MSGGVFLGGGGSEEDELAVWAALFAYQPTMVTVWPFAQRRYEDREATSRWILCALERYDVHVHVAVNAEQASRTLNNADVLMIPGGNAFDLLAELQQNGLLPKIRTFVSTGGFLYGGSAGAILAGSHIAIAALLDENELLLKDFRGLDLLEGVVVLPHASPQILLEAREWSRRHGQAVLVLPERGGVSMVDRRLRVEGPEPVVLVTPDRQITYETGVSISVRDLLPL